jgi:heat shock protein HslJ
MRVARYLACLAGVSLLVAGSCGDDDVEAAATTELEGTTWALADDSSLGVPVGGVTVTARFDDGTLNGTSGCNSYSTTYEVDGSSLSIAPEIVGTLIACSDPAGAVETAYLDLLPDVASYEIDGSTLTLANDDDEDLLVYEAIVGADAIQGEWTVTGYYSGDAITSVLGGATLTAELAAGSISGDTGCNTFSGGYTVDGDTIEIGELASTLTACPSEELAQQEADYLAALGLATSYEVAGDRLDLLRDDGAIAVSFESG